MDYLHDHLKVKKNYKKKNQIALGFIIQEISIFNQDNPVT